MLKPTTCLLVMLVLVVPAACAESVRVVNVIDEATVRVFVDGATRELRLIGLAPSERGSAYARRAREKLEELVLRREVRLKYDRVRRSTDGKLLGYVYVRWGRNDIFVNAHMLELGHARLGDFGGNAIHKKEFEALNRNARRAGRGRFGPTGSSR